MNKIIPSTIIANAYRLFLNNSFFIISLILIVITSSVLFSTIQEAMLEASSIQWSVFSIASQLFTMGLSLGMSHAMILLINAKEASIAHMFEKFDLIFRYLGATMLFSIALLIAMIPGLIILSLSIDISSILTFNIVDYLVNRPEIDFRSIQITNTSIVGLVLILIGFLYVYVRLQFYQYSILYKKRNAIHSLQESYFITKNNITELLTLLLIIISINILGALLIFGLFISLPISMIAIIMAYFSLINEENQEEQVKEYKHNNQT